jgi:PAS domain S-box-containing protein
MADAPRAGHPRVDGAGRTNLVRGIERYRAEVESRVARLPPAAHALQEMAGGEIDAVVDPRTAAPILLSHAQHALARSEARYRDIVERSPALVCELSTDGIVRFVNAAAHTCLGFAPDALVGMHFWESLIAAPDAWWVARRDDARRRLQAGEITGVELPVRGADAGIRWFSWNSANRRGLDGALEEIVLFGSDVTAQREAAERAHQLESERLARAEAEAANAAKTKFLAVMSHELRTPLNAISGYVQLLEMGLRGPLSPGQLEDLARIRRAQRHLLGLINDVMNFARLESGALSLGMQDVPLQPVFETLASLTEPQTQAKGIAYRVAECAADVAVWTDREKLLQVLINLVSNAIKFTPPGGRIEVDCAQSAESVAIRVADTGDGIPEDKLSSIFEPFVQVRSDYTRPADGVGLGLAISRDLTRALGGELSVRSAVGAGSTFTVTLPRRSTAAAARA